MIKNIPPFTNPFQEDVSNVNYVFMANLNFEIENNTNELENIEQRVDMFTTRSTFLTMIQTDKPKYKPGDTVRMRLFFIHSDGTAVQDSDISNFHVEIRNRFEEKSAVFSERSFEPRVYTFKFLLGEYSFEGIYKIHVWTNVEEDKGEGSLVVTEGDPGGDDNTKIDSIIEGDFRLNDAISQNFTVEKYVLTEFTLHVTSKRIVRPHTKIDVKIDGEYSFGKHVIGKAQVIAKVIRNGEKLREFENSIIVGSNSETFKIVSIDTFNDLGLHNSIEDYDVQIDVIFTDDLSKQKRSNTLMVKVAQTDNVKLVLIPEEDFLRPGVNFGMKVYLKDIDGNPIESTKKHVVMGVTFHYQFAKCEDIDPKSRKKIYAEAGSKNIDNFYAKFAVKVPYNTTSIEFEASYDDGEVKEKFSVTRTSDVPVSRNYVSLVPQKNR